MKIQACEIDESRPRIRGATEVNKSTKGQGITHDVYNLKQHKKTLNSTNSHNNFQKLWRNL